MITEVKEAAAFIQGYICAKRESIQNDPRKEEIYEAIRIIAKVHSNQPIEWESTSKLIELAKSLWQRSCTPVRDLDMPQNKKL